MNLIEEAIIYSTIMYQGKVRKINRSPFILHPLEVAQILSTMTDDMEVIAAGVLHDIVEGTDGTLTEIRTRFGDRVAFLVDSETEEDYPEEDKADSWKKRKEGSIKKLSASRDKGVKMLWLADKLANLRSLAGSYGEIGEGVWDYLHQKDPKAQLWYYKTVAELVEMDLNRTGSYKEYIDRINYIWPGTFDSRKTKYREYRKITVDPASKIGQGAKSEIYRYDDECVVKVYNDHNTYADVEREIQLSRTAFVMGLPTAISFGIVSVGDRYGAMFELIEAKTISELIAKNPGTVDYYAGLMARLALKIHAIKPKETKDFPCGREILFGWLENAFDEKEPEVEVKLRALADSLPVPAHLIHGDFHTGNVFLSKGEPLFIDVDRMAIGDPLMDISGIFLFYSAYAEIDPEIIRRFMGFSAERARRFYEGFVEAYYEGVDEEEKEDRIRKAQILAYGRLIYQVRERGLHSPFHEDPADYLRQKIKALLENGYNG